MIPNEVYIFAGRIARAMNELKSSHVYFIIQQAYKDEDMEWGEVQALLDRVIEQTKEVIKGWE